MTYFPIHNLYIWLIYLLLLSEIIQLYIFSEFLSFIYVTSKFKYFTQSYWASQNTSTVLHATLFYNINVMLWSHVTSHMMDLTKSGQFQIITDPAPRSWLSHQSLDYLTFQINLPTFGSTFWINLLNQPTQSAFSLNWRCHWLVVRRFLQTSPTCRDVKCITLKHPLVAVWMKALLDAAKNFSLMQTSASSSGKSERREWRRP